MRFVDVSRVRSRFDEPVEARDGTRLSVDLYLPPESGSFPVLLTLTPYDNNRFSTFAGALSPADAAIAKPPAARFKELAAQGFVVVAADARGRGDSDGEFVPFVHEAADGARIVEWARALPEADGRVGAFGSGYAGFAALAAAAEGGIDALVVSSPFSGDGLPRSGGLPRLEWLFWMHLVGGRTPQPVDVPNWPAVFRHRPLVSMDEALGRADIWWAEWLEDGPRSPAAILGEHPKPPTAPTLFVTGWWDPALAATAELWEAAKGAHPEAGHELLIGPWDARSVRRPDASVGGIHWGPAATVDPDRLLTDWFSTRLEPAERPRRCSARVFVTGRNEWADLDTLGHAEETLTLWLGSGGGANTRRGDGRLAAGASPGGPPDRFTHDPGDPVPWQPGGGSFSRTAGRRLTLATEFATGRDDVLVYDSAPFSPGIGISGRPTVHLWVETTAPDADWIVAIADLFPGGGRSQYIAHGAIRGGSADPSPSGGPRELVVELPPVAHQLLPGHMLRLLVCSSLFPLYAVNLGGGDHHHGTAARRTEHTLFHSAEHQSRIELAVRDW